MKFAILQQKKCPEFNGPFYWAKWYNSPYDSKIGKEPFTQEYAEAIEQTVETLERMEEEVMNCMIMLATTGKWKKWSDEQPIGTKVEFSEEKLRNTGDVNVDLLCGLMDKILKVRENMDS
jgi:hypothetical protein